MQSLCRLRLPLTHNGGPSRSSSSLHRETARSRLGAVRVICQRTSGDTHTKSVFKPIEKNRLDLMAPTTTRQIKTPQEKALQDTCSTLAQLYVDSEVRGGSSDKFFSHENQIYPPSLSENGNLRSNTKSDLVTLLEKIANLTPYSRVQMSRCCSLMEQRLFITCHRISKKHLLTMCVALSSLISAGRLITTYVWM